MPSIKDRATSLLLSRIGKTASVNNVHRIGNFLMQVELQLPQLLPDHGAQYLKCEVAPHTYRDYTIAHWNASTQIATLLIDCGHDGAGSYWALDLQPGQEVYYVRPGSGIHLPITTPYLVCIGDTSAAAYFYTVYEQKAATQHFHCFMPLDNPKTRQILQMPVQPLSDNQHYFTDLHEWLYSHNFPSAETTFNVAGNQQMVVQVCNSLRQLGGQVKTQYFWG